jgi:hypothetical protein
MNTCTIGQLNIITERKEKTINLPLSSDTV